MRRIRRLCVAFVLGVLAAAVLEVGALGAVTNHAKRGAVFQGTGRQPNWPTGWEPPRGYAGSGTFSLRFRVARDGRHVTQIRVWGLAALCGSQTYPYQYPRLPDPELGSAPIRRGGTFQADLEPTEDGALSPVTVVGRFLSRGRASGTLHYRGHYRDLPSCPAEGTWTAHVKPPPPPVQQFTGTTAQGTRVTFQRTIERHPHVLRFNFGSLHTHPGSPTAHCGTVTVATGREHDLPFDEFSLPVNRGRFFGNYFDKTWAAIFITGRFDAKDQASGKVWYNNQSSDCGTGDVQWTAHAAARRTTGLG